MGAQLTVSVLRDAIRKNVDCAGLSKEPYEARGIFHSEMAAILGLVKELKVDMLIETGRARGQSTYVLGKHLPGVQIVSVEWAKDADAEFAERRVAGLDNVELVYGNAFDVVPTLLKSSGPKSVALLIDGPKYRPALELLQKSFLASGNLKIGFIHDLSKDRPARYEVPDFFENAIFTDDSDFVAEFKHLDQGVFGAGNWRAPFHSKGKKRKSYGPTLGVFMPSAGDQLGRRPALLTRLARRIARALA